MTSVNPQSAIRNPQSPPGRLIGMDEAGYGPNLGPLVVTATVWSTPEDPRDADLWTAFDQVVCNHTRDAERLAVGDSKSIYTPARGIGLLERAVLALVGLRAKRPTTLRELGTILGLRDGSWDEPWSADELTLPMAANADEIDRFTARWKAACESSGVFLADLRSDAVQPARWNRMLREYGNKSTALSKTSFQLLKEVWQPDERTWIIADKHGGRNRYDELLAEILDDSMVFRLEEGRQLSRYRVGESQVEFQTKAERHFPVAVASMVCKYFREASMNAFNRYWCERVPGLRPTKGYPVDAKRFHAEIAERQQDFGIDDDVVWREK